MKPFRWLAIATWTLGTVLIATYAGTRWWYAHSREQGVMAFEAARDSVRLSSSEPAAAFDPSAAAIDMSTRSLGRIERYRESVTAATVPQALLRIPSVKLVVPVFEGASEQNLNGGAGRIEGTARIGESGNIGIAAHRDGFFRVLKDVRIGDVLLLDRLTVTDTYRIVSTTVVDPSEVGVLAPTLTGSVTLVTCYPFYYAGSAPRRFIVRAERVTSKKTPADKGPAGVKSRVAAGRMGELLSDDGDKASRNYRGTAPESR